MYHPLARSEAGIQNNVYIFRIYWKYWSDWDTVDDIAGRSGDQILVGQEIFLAVYTGPKAHLSYCTTAFLSVVKRPEHGAHNPPFTSGDLRMGWSSTSATSLCLHGYDIRRPLPWLEIRSWDNAVSVMTTLRAGRSRVRIPAGKIAFPSLKRRDKIWCSPGLAFIPGVKRPGRDVDRLPLFGTEVKNMWSYTSSPLYAFLDNFTFVSWTKDNVRNSIKDLTQTDAQVF